MGSSNFLQIDVSASNIESDAAYSTDSIRTGGWVAGQLVPSPIFNKMWYQTSTMVAALGTALANAGQTVADSSLSDLITSISTVFSNAFPPDYIIGLNPAWTSTTSLTIPVGQAKSSDFTTNIQLASPATLSISASGANGLDTGTVATNTWYYVYLIYNPTTLTTGALFSVTNESVSGSVTLPSGYTKKRQLPYAIKTNGSSQLYDISVYEGWPYFPRIQYNVSFPGTPTAGTTNVVTDTTATSGFVTASAAAFVPPCSTLCWLHSIFQNGSSGEPTAAVRQNGVSHNGYIMPNGSGAIYQKFLYPMDLDSSQNLQYSQSALGNFTIDVHSYIITGIL